MREKLLTTLEVDLMLRMINKLACFTESEETRILADSSKFELEAVKENNLDFNSDNKYILCSTLETLYSIFSIILSEVRAKKRETLTSIFEVHPDLIKEKSTLEKKLDSIPEYANYKEKEEYLFQFLEHIKSVKETIRWLAICDVKSDDID